MVHVRNIDEIKSRQLFFDFLARSGEFDKEGTKNRSEVKRRSQLATEVDSSDVLFINDIKGSQSQKQKFPSFHMLKKVY